MVLAEGKDLAIIACGHMVEKSLLALQLLAAKGISAKLINLHTPKPWIKRRS